MEGKDTLSIKRTLYNVGTQHNKLTTMVMVCLKEIDKLKSEMKELKIKNNIPVNHEEDNVSQQNMNNTSNSSSSDLENEAQNILKQLNLK